MKVPNEYRLTSGPMGSISSFDGNNGVFNIPKDDLMFRVIASDGLGWEHVSVSIPNEKRTPTWEEMCWLKDLFWDKDDCVVQYHPPEKEYVNNHNYVLHLWRPRFQQIPMPDVAMV